jgi:hypothetical protein
MQHEMRGFRCGENKVYCVLECDMILCDRGLPTFRINVLSLLDGLSYDPEYISNAFLKNVIVLP